MSIFGVQEEQGTTFRTTLQARGTSGLTPAWPEAGAVYLMTKDKLSLIPARTTV